MSSSSPLLCNNTNQLLQQSMLDETMISELEGGSTSKQGWWMMVSEVEGGAFGGLEGGAAY